VKFKSYHLHFDSVHHHVRKKKPAAILKKLKNHKNPKKPLKTHKLAIILNIAAKILKKPLKTF
jgi:hypothetical protein